MVPVVDLFAGPGGLAEGFSACRRPDGRRKYRIALSIEKDAVAHRTLLLRAFLRNFASGFPPEYYDFLNGVVPEEPEWAKLYPTQWAAARDEAKHLELGTSAASVFLRKQIARIREGHGGRTVLLGGPPCQAYSVIGRSRNAGNTDYNADEDDRQLLYKQYVDVLRRLQPAVAVMENVKGMLSARLNEKLIFPQVMRRLRNAGGKDRYRLFALASRSGAKSWQDGLTPEDFLVNAEAHGVPQARHRVFVICVRADIAEALDEEHFPRLEPESEMVPLRDIIGVMPRLRSRLSKDDDPGSWQDAVRAGHTLIVANQPAMSNKEAVRFRKALARALAVANGPAPPSRNAHGKTSLPKHCPRDLGNWIFDDELRKLPNNETRGHIAEDLVRYLFAAAFGYAFRRSPKTCDFPKALMADHANWDTGHFSDRYRVQLPHRPSTTVTSHLSKDGHYFIHPDSGQCRSLTVREVARLQTFPDNYFFHGGRTQQYVQVGNAVPPFLAHQIALTISSVLDRHDRVGTRRDRVSVASRRQPPSAARPLPSTAMERT
ncbi:MAG: DNA cytosine methyltransferase [Acidobacteria bacterium]|nr:DNA cytosine methyltransferase [Acidobacteriota bacterium]